MLVVSMIARVQISITCWFDSLCSRTGREIRRIVMRRALERVRRYRGLRFRPPQSVWGTNGSVARADTGDVNRIRPLAFPGTATGLLLFVLTLLLGLALGLPPLRVAVRRTVVTTACSCAAPVFVVGAGRVVGERVARARIRVVAEAWEVTLDLACPWAGTSLVAFEENDIDAALGEERVIPELDQLGGDL